MSDNGGSGIAARLILGVIVATVANAYYTAWDGPFLALARWVLAALVVLWVVAGAASDDGGARKAGLWALFGIGVASAGTMLLFMSASSFLTENWYSMS